MVLRDDGFIVHSSIVFKMSSCTLETEYSRMNLSTLENDVTCAVSSRLSILVRSTIKYEKKSFECICTLFDYKQKERVKDAYINEVYSNSEQL